MLGDSVSHANEFFVFSDGKKQDLRFFIKFLLLDGSETLPPEWRGISLQIRQRAGELKIPVCDDDKDLAILEKIGTVIGDTNLKKLEGPLRTKGRAMKRWDAMSQAERNAEIEARRVARDNELLAARHERRKESGVSTKPRERRTADKSGAGTGGGDSDSGDSDSSDEPDPPAPITRAQSPHPLTPPTGHPKPKYHNKRGSHRCWRLPWSKCGVRRCAA